MDCDLIIITVIYVLGIVINFSFLNTLYGVCHTVIRDLGMGNDLPNPNSIILSKQYILNPDSRRTASLPPIGDL
jgi:hypothetical protein